MKQKSTRDQHDMIITEICKNGYSTPSGGLKYLIQITSMTTVITVLYSGVCIKQHFLRNVSFVTI